jgi:nucleoside-diphosphate-sugar epimerase
MKVLITGGLGFIGSHLTKYLVGEGCDVTVTTRSRFDGGHLILSKDTLDKIKVIECQYMCALNIYIDFKSFDVIYHCAANISRDGDTYDAMNVNLMETISLFDLCKDADVKIVCLSTFLIVGTSSNNEGEDPKDGYSLSKLCMEQVIKLYNNNYGMNIKIARLTNVIGRNQFKQNTIIQRALDCIERDEPVNVYNLHFSRDYIHVLDVVTALKLIAEDGYKSYIYYVGTGVSTTTKKVIDTIINKVKKPATYNVIEAPESSIGKDVIKFSCDVLPIHRLDWECVHTFDDIVDDLIKERECL